MTGADEGYRGTVDEDDTRELVAQLRQLAGADPVTVRQVVAEVLTALDRVAGGALRDQLPEAIRLDAGLDGATPGHS
jgi:predicted nucleic acid-binding protein